MNETNTTIQLIEKFGTKVDSYILILAQKLSVGAEYLWTILVKQQFYEGIVQSSFLLMGLIFGIVLVSLNRKKKFFNEAECPLPRFFTTIIGAIILVIVFITVARSGSDILTKFLNPEYAALADILSKIK